MLTRARAVISAVSMKREMENMRNYLSHLSPWEYVFVEEPYFSRKTETLIIFYLARMKFDKDR